jgi:hypothetical protein
MEGNGSRKLSWIAIALGGLALFVALSGRMQSQGGRFNGPQAYNRPSAFQARPAAPGQAGPQGQFDPRGQVGPEGQFDPRGQFGPQDQAGPRGQFGPRGGFEEQTRWGGPRHGFPLFFLPFMLFGGLIKIAFVVLLVMLGLRLIRGGGRGPWGHGPDSPPSDQTPPSRPGPEQPPYTGDTQQM